MENILNLFPKLHAMPTVQDIVDYYQFSKFDYQLYNGSFSNISMHFGLWDEHTRTHKQALLNENRVLADIASITKRDNVADFGCGYGISAIWLAHNRGCRVTGITVDPEQVKFAKELARKNKVQDVVTFETADYHHTVFPDSSFDVVFAIESISHSEHKDTVLREAYRVLKNGGRLVVADGFFAKNPATLTKQEAEIARKCFEGVHVPPVARKEDFEQYIRNAGFSKIAFHDKTNAILPTAKRVNRLGRMMYPLSKVLAPLGVKAMQASHMDAFINQYYAFRDGIGVYGVFHAEK
jgi:ubiquinone/menaquinone biosynthesis C-methylase UbiE